MARKHQPQRPLVDFIVDEDLPEPCDLSRRSRESARKLAAYGLLDVLAVVVLLAVGSRHDPGTARLKRAASPSAAPSSPAPACTSSCSSDGTPTRAIVATFQADLPGSIVVTETTSTRRDARRKSEVVQRRVVNVVYGNVRMTATAELAEDQPARTSRPVVELRERGYLIRFAFRGWYPPTRRQLRRLADDPRLTSART